MKRFLLLAFTSLFLIACQGDAYITTDPQSLFFSDEGGTQSVVVTSVGEYTATTDAKWLRIETTSTGIDVTAMRNVDNPERKASIVISAIDGEASISLEVIQESDPCCVIYYTTVDSTPITLNSTNVFGANIISNTYENGIGAIRFDAHITKIGAKAFWGCYLESITIPDTILSIGKEAFYECRYLKSIVIPNHVFTIEQSAFSGCYNLASVVIGDSVIEIDNYAFRDCRTLESITIPDNVVELGESAFASCSNLTTAVIGNKVLGIRDFTFWCCSKLENVTIGNSVTSIGESAFTNCNLTSVTIPENVTWIGYHAFDDCKNLKSVYCKPTTPPDVYGWMFDYSVSSHEAAPIGCDIFVPSGSVSAYKAKDGWKRYSSYIKPYSFE